MRLRDLWNFFLVIWDFVALGERWEMTFYALVDRLYY